MTTVGVLGEGDQMRPLFCGGHRLRRSLPGVLILLLVIQQGGLDGILRQHGAMQFHRWKGKLLGNIRVLNLARVVHRLSLDPLRRQ